MEAKGSQNLKKVGQCLYRNGHGTYYALIKVGGKQIKRSLKTKDAAHAKRKLGSLRTEAVELKAEDRNLVMDDLAKLWLESVKPELKKSSFERREFSWKQLKPFFRGKLVREIGPKDFQDWKTKRGLSLSARSYNLEIETLRLIFEYAKDIRGIMLVNPAKAVERRKLPKHEIIIPSKAQFQVLLERMRRDPRGREASALVEFLGYSGLRLGEATSVEWDNVNFELRTLLITGGEKGTKNHEVRVIPLFPPLERFLDELKRTQTEPNGRIFKIDNAKKSLTTACQKLGIPHFSHHSMRHFFCSNAIEAGIDFMTISKWLGHKDNGILVASTYGHLRNEHSTAMAKRMTFDASVGDAKTQNVISLSLG